MTPYPAADGPAGHAPHDPYAALRVGNFRRFLIGTLVANLGLQMQSMAVGWEIYARTQSAFALSLVGLIQVLPAIAMAIPAGHAADRLPRRAVVVSGALLSALSSLALAVISLYHAPLEALYLSLAVNATARSFQQPAKSALLPQIVPRHLFSSAVTWSTGGFQLSSVCGPALGGFLIAAYRQPAIVYGIAAIGTLTLIVMLAGVRYEAGKRDDSQVTLKSLAAGFSFVWNHQVILAALALDLFAVLLGGAVTLLPIYAADILHVGPQGLGWMEAAPALGALGMALVQAHRPPPARAGRSLLWAVSGFGMATIVFGLSKTYWISLAALCMTGALDNISVVIRHTLVQMLTPDAMRGRVSAVNSMFIGASNELGGFESGQVAWLFGPVVSVVFGGIGTLVVVVIAALACPKLRRQGPIDIARQGPTVLATDASDAAGEADAV